MCQQALPVDMAWAAAGVRHLCCLGPGDECPDIGNQTNQRVLQRLRSRLGRGSAWHLWPVFRPQVEGHSPFMGVGVSGCTWLHQPEFSPRGALSIQS